METALEFFERVVRGTRKGTPMNESGVQSGTLHPFELRNVHPNLPQKVRKLFDDGHGAEATFLAFKYIEKVVQRLSGKTENGQKLMMLVFDRNKPIIRLNSLANQSEQDEQEGYRFMFSGAVIGIRNPAGHEVILSDDPDVCLDHLAFASLLLRRLERSGHK
ncbi:TIGR02391 family protein [Paraburkholderia steynii]|uniref:TIGR02391 family protein n=1 Tax=Paraburkholderia steynii TaxID=1245441 RepID=UPI000B86F57A|nr:TIGR02391 family protein [Paraburkholderia steynii]